MIKSPCISVCRLQEGVCEGCGRTTEEIMRWPYMANEEKMEVLKRLQSTDKKLDS